ncbi:hypothetical protein [Paraburkholderia sp. J41]|uniref:hypothetical protein n=1 Tax=Paraburkholderia sp. J41 TaxID=2805433 RepID=UPI002AC365C1|nr:hypothetical protein [Paraburkholderia sp. J41]
MAAVAFPMDVDSFRRSPTQTCLPDEIVNRLTAQARPAILLTTRRGAEAMPRARIPVPDARIGISVELRSTFFYQGTSVMRFDLSQAIIFSDFAADTVNVTRP